MPMPQTTTDNILEYLEKETLSKSSALAWVRTSPHAFAASLRGIEIELYAVPAFTEQRWCLALWWGPDRLELSAPDRLVQAVQWQLVGRAPADSSRPEWFYDRLAGCDTLEEVEVPVG